MTRHDSSTAAEGSALGRCVACPPQEFAERYWGQRPLLTRAAELGGDFADLLNPDAVDALVSEHGLRVPFARMAKAGEVLAPARFTRSGGAGATIADQLADDRVLVRLGEGATLVLQALHRSWAPLVRFGSQLATELGHPIQINAYITPPQNQGFAPHYDVHDVFVLQVAGRKHWTIHEPVRRDPLPDESWEARRDEVSARVAGDAPLITADLEPGDALYLPRGTIHAAEALGETSIHLTVGVHPLTRRTLVEQLVGATVDDGRLRASLPMGVELDDPDVLAPHLAATVEALRAALAEVDPATVADGVAARLRRDTRPEPVGPLAQLRAADHVGPDTAVRLRPGLRYVLRPPAAGAAALRLELADRTVALPAGADAALKRVLSGVVFTPAELDGLDPERRLELARLLLREAVIVPAAG